MKRDEANEAFRSKSQFRHLKAAHEKKEATVPAILSANTRMANAQLSEGRGSPLPTAAWHMLPAAEAVERQQSDLAQGLTQAEAARRLAQYGPNTLAQARQRSTLSIFLAQFQSLIVALLVAATAIAFAMGENIEAVAILIVIVINASIGFFTE